LGVARTRQQLMQQLDEVNNAMPTNASVDFQLPAFFNISTAFELNATVVKTHFLVVFATIFELLGITLFLFNHYSSATLSEGCEAGNVIYSATTVTGTPASLAEKVRELESANRFLLERLEYNRLSLAPAETAVSTAIEKIRANYQKGEKLTYSGLSKKLHRSHSFVKKVLDRMIENGLARSIFLS